ncbi:MAG: tetratricopeptide repeat protein [Candidatus Acidiferrales bacterium]
MSATTHHTLTEKPPGGYPREVVFVLCFIALVILVSVTAFLSRMYHKKVHTLADQLFAQGQRDMQQARIDAALTDYRNAIAYNPYNTKFQFALAKALAAAGRGDEANAYLLNLLAETPGSGEINLELARIAAKNKSISNTVRYYQGAIYGEWTGDPIGMRWEVRKELCEYLLNRAGINQAVPEVIALAQNTPPADIARLKIAGQLLLRTHLSNRAQDVYREVLAADGNDEEAVAGAAQAAFELGQYSEAMQYFDRLPRERREAPDIAALYDITRRVLALDPFLSGLSKQVRAQRAVQAVVLAQARLEKCASQNQPSLQQTPPRTDLQKLFAQFQSAQADWTLRNLEHFPERLDAAMAFVFNAENAAAAECGEAENDDRALGLLGRSRSMVNR